MSIINSNFFSYSKKNRTFYAEASELGHSRNFLSRLYPDSCDTGFEMMSAKTGNFEKFYLDEEPIVDGETLHWVFLPVNSKLNCRVVIFND